MVLRLVAGCLKGAALAVPDGTALRPTSARRREAVLDILRAQLGTLEGLHAADLFAGTGAVGFEMLSAGAGHVTFVERDPTAATLIRRNAAALGLADRITLRRDDATTLGPAPRALDAVFLDPPYGQGLAERALARLVAGGWLAPEAPVLVELGRTDPFEPPPGLVIVRTYRHGAGRLVRLEQAAPSAAADGTAR